MLVSRTARSCSVTRPVSVDSGTLGDRLLPDLLSYLDEASHELFSGNVAEKTRAPAGLFSQFFYRQLCELTDPLGC